MLSSSAAGFIHQRKTMCQKSNPTAKYCSYFRVPRWTVFELTCFKQFPAMKLLILFSSTFKLLIFRNNDNDKLTAEYGGKI